MSHYVGFAHHLPARLSRRASAGRRRMFWLSGLRMVAGAIRQDVRLARCCTCIPSPRPEDRIIIVATKVADPEDLAFAD
jgi:hypothetical protein